MRATFAALHAGRLVDVAKIHLVVVPVPVVGTLIAAGAVTLGDHVATMTERVLPGALLGIDTDAVAPHAFPPQHVALDIAYEDDDLAIVDKPSGMHVHPLGPYREGTLLNALLWHCGARPEEPWAAWRPAPIHRLDRAARGLVIFAKSAAIHDVLRGALERHEIVRRYEAVVAGDVQGDAGTIDAPIGRDPAFDYRRAIVPVDAGGQPAITHWRVVERRGDTTRVALQLATGRTHQIRVHLASIGHPIAGDALYAAGAATGDTSVEIALHACELVLSHPRTGKALHIRRT